MGNWRLTILISEGSGSSDVISAYRRARELKLGSNGIELNSKSVGSVHRAPMNTHSVQILVAWGPKEAKESPKSPPSGWHAEAKVKM